MADVYSLKRDGKMRLSANFFVSEFACKDGSDYILIDDKLVELLQKIRDYFKQPVAINSAYRNLSYNLRVGGVSNSQHTQGTAADIVVKGITPKEVAMFAEYHMPDFGGIGLYSNFTHVDVRKNRSRWENFGKEKTVTGFYGFVPKIEELEKNEDNVWELAHRGIISEYEKWVAKGKMDMDVYWLMRKVVKFMRDKGV